MIQRKRLLTKGIVQGVGFRPFIYSLAKRYKLGGFVYNLPEGVIIEIEGETGSINGFLDELKIKFPPRAEIEEIKEYALHPEGDGHFSIKDSLDIGEKASLISPDLSICKDCLNELFDKKDRRYLYPFINCTNCGPRFTIIEDIPYDRPKTVMKEFIMCKNCSNEYNTPSNRRFHAQPNACSKCGPQVTLESREPRKLASLARGKQRMKNRVRNPIKEAARLLIEGKIVAIKGLGGYHLSCDATSSETIKLLRRKKGRFFKPFALMAANIDIIKKYCIVNEKERRLLTSYKSPIVLLEKRKNCSIPDIVAPMQRYLGFMLPYAPLHHILFYYIYQFSNEGKVLVMTSGNVTDEPIVYEDNKVKDKLGRICDYILTHNRKIYIRCDDSVTRIWKDKEYIIRRARGYAPYPVKLNKNFKYRILACGAHLKNTFCLTRDNYAFISQHIGDLENLEAMGAYEKAINHFRRLFDINPEVIAYDMHPEYLSTKYALSLSSSARLIPAQHHHAHITSCMAENGIEDRVIGVAFDGLGMGCDGKLWGGEFLIADYADFERISHLKYIPLPGSQQAIKQPWRMAASFLYETYGEGFLNLDIDFVKRLDKAKWRILKKLIQYKINTPLTSSVGRLFDAISAILEIRDFSEYEGQAAIELEMTAKQASGSRLQAPSYKYNIIKTNQGIYIVEPNLIIRGIIEDIKKSEPVSTISLKFHITLAEIVKNVCKLIREDTEITEVVLSGGVFQNMLLLNLVYAYLNSENFKVYIHSKVPANDGGISLGQAVIADAKTAG